MPGGLIPFLPLIASGVNAISSMFTNRSQIKHNQQMYDKQRADTLADWQMSNEYNSPAAQMRRFKEAGLNPNLIYGQQNVSPVIKSPDLKNADFVAPRIDPDTTLSFMDYATKKQTVDNLQKQNEVLDANIKLINANTMKSLKDTDLKTFQLAKGNALLDYDIDAAKEQLYSMRASTALKLGENERKWIMQSHTINETLQKIAKLKADISKVPLEKQMIQANINALLQETNFRRLSNPQRIRLNNELIESQLFKNLILDKERKGVDLDNDIKELKRNFMMSGLSEKFASDFIEDILRLFGRR